MARNGGWAKIVPQMECGGMVGRDATGGGGILGEVTVKTELRRCGTMPRSPSNYNVSLVK